MPSVTTWHSLARLGGRNGGGPQAGIWLAVLVCANNSPPGAHPGPCVCVAHVGKWQRREPESTVLYRIVQSEWATSQSLLAARDRLVRCGTKPLLGSCTSIRSPLGLLRGRLSASLQTVDHSLGVGDGRVKRDDDVGVLCLNFGTSDSGHLGQHATHGGSTTASRRGLLKDKFDIGSVRGGLHRAAPCEHHQERRSAWNGDSVHGQSS
ncbi:MAG: hypothetical protein ACI88C_000363 [Acidimicrobiales bacterium]|jgi:hypothetical protein